MRMKITLVILVLGACIAFSGSVPVVTFEDVARAQVMPVSSQPHVFRLLRTGVGNSKRQNVIDIRVYLSQGGSIVENSAELCGTPKRAKEAFEAELATWFECSD